MEELMIWLGETVETNGGGLPELPQELLPLLQALREKVETAESAKKEAEELLSFYKASADAMPNPISIKDDQLRFVFFNRAYREFFGLEADAYIGKRVLDLDYLPPEERERYHAEDREMLDTQSVAQYEASFRVEGDSATESLYWSKGFETPDTGRRGVISEIVDISKEKQLQRELIRSMHALELVMKDTKDASKIDPVTKLYNRNVLAEEVPAMLEETAAANRPVCAMLMDIDYFKQINDTYGHLYGDEILLGFAKILTASFRKSDITIRYGGDEFIVILPGAQLQQAQNSAERLCSAVRAGLVLPDGRPATISVGVTEWQPGEELLPFISRADEALYLSKRSGRNRVSVK